jgi:RNA recognition motif-containing protein
MGNKLFVGSLAWATDSDGLRAAFEKFGEITDAVVILERDTGRSRGFGFVTFAEDSAAQDAIAGMDGQDLDGRNIRVNEAQERRGGGGGGRGGYRGGGGGGGYRGGGGGRGGYGGGGGGRGGYGGGGGGGRGGYGGGGGGGRGGGGGGWGGGDSW